MGTGSYKQCISKVDTRGREEREREKRDLERKGGEMWTEPLPQPVSLSPGWYFGLSAATGGLGDNHDVFSFSTTTPEVNGSRESRERNRD
jgi:hypothetical protein